LLVELLGGLGDVHWTTSAEQALEIGEGRTAGRATSSAGSSMTRLSPR
jgi:hypothetical protein